MPAARLGLGYSPAGVRRFMNVLGAANTTDIFCPGAQVRREGSAAHGLRQRVAPAADLEKRSPTTARRWSANAPLTVRRGKKAVAAVAEGDRSATSPR